MVEYIDRKKLLAHIKDLPTWWADVWGYNPNSMKYPDGLFCPDDIISSVENAPTADVVEVVRCRDCKYYHLFEEGFRDCRHTSGLDDVKQDDFCCYGERRVTDQCTGLNTTKTETK